MRSTRSQCLMIVLLLILCFSMEAWLDPRAVARDGQRSATMASLLFGESRRIFANHFFMKADAYFHSGFYPTVFDNRESFQTAHMAEDAGALKSNNSGDETGFMGKPRDIIEAFERHFMPSVHTHLDQGGPQQLAKAGSDLGEGKGGDVREILPWLKLSAALDPNRIETYMVTAYWLRRRMGKVAEAEEFLREGLRANPRDPSLLFELGRIYQEDRHDPDRARNIWEVAVGKMDEQKTPLNDQQQFMLMQLTMHLASVEESRKNLQKAIAWLERDKTVSPNPEVVQKHIDELKLAAGGAGANKAVGLK
jgi:tetratricopeptide (TPR) repeat protein